ncbi:response regulator transcription factor [Paucihalobacter ruber]|uniref:Response regulator transcription factor n=1 Tax=Paucihalobacter ruber TaxID=2567861 RepID=A0A506PQL1_9FLAO|nr:LytTR family DNA-binding domain-containing protein [Paucihalobacter ruber]TPV35931.1 response regulator transcription factor [Paucihalobacter ruber]
MISVVIVDDELSAVESLVWELKHFNTDISVVAQFTNPEEAIDYLTTNNPDCLFLDIQMPTMDGFQFLNKFPKRDFAVVITTAYNEYAIKALKHEAIDYLLKPIDSDDLQETIKKIKKHKSKQKSELNFELAFEQFNERFNKKKVTINTDGKLIFIDADDILLVSGDGNYSTIELANNQKIVVTKKLKEVNSLLPQDHFFRIHNSYIINLNHLKEFIKSDGYVVLTNNKKIPVARQRKSDFLEKL